MDFALVRLATAAGLLALASACESHTAGGSPVDVADSSMEASCGDAAADVTLPPLVTEAGFIAIPPQPTAAKYAARMFYDFQPADTDPESKPLFVLFNGGPGFATSGNLLLRGTGRMTLPPLSPDKQRFAPPDGGWIEPVANPASWTRFGNLLYLDERLAGFSYGLLPSAACSRDGKEDASDFVRALLAFLEGHPALRGSPVVLVGESYGGVRASYMLDMLLRYQTEAAVGGADLPGLIQAHYDAIFGCSAGTAIDEATAAQQFGWQVFIEPQVMGNEQETLQAVLQPTDPYVGSADPCKVDSYDAAEPYGWTGANDVQAVEALSDPAVAQALLGVDPRAIADLGPAARTGAFDVAPYESVQPPISDASVALLPDGGPLPGNPFCKTAPTSDALMLAVAAMDAQLTALLGPLIKGDGYYNFIGAQCYQFNDGSNDDTSQQFLANLRHVRTFITHARYDQVIYAPSIPAAIAYYGLGGTVDSAPRPGVARPGWFTVNLPAAGSAPPQNVEVRFPLYEHSGHMVTMSQAADLASDVQAWMQGQ